jgi:hypothetical protein
VLRGRLAGGHLDLRRADLALADLLALPLHRVPAARLVRRCWELRHSFTVYDAAYVALAEALAVTLVTADTWLAEAPGPAQHDRRAPLVRCPARFAGFRRVLVDLGVGPAVAVLVGGAFAVLGGQSSGWRAWVLRPAGVGLQVAGWRGMVQVLELVSVNGRSGRRVAVVAGTGAFDGTRCLLAFRAGASRSGIRSMSLRRAAVVLVVWGR